MLSLQPHFVIIDPLSMLQARFSSVVCTSMQGKSPHIHILCGRLGTWYTVCRWLYDVSEWSHGWWPHVFHGGYTNYSTVWFSYCHFFFSCFSWSSSLSSSSVCIHFAMNSELLCAHSVYCNNVRTREYLLCHIISSLGKEHIAPVVG